VFLCDPEYPLAPDRLFLRLLELQRTFPRVIRSWPTINLRKPFDHLVEITALANTNGGFITVGFQPHGLENRFVPVKGVPDLLGLRDILAQLPDELRTDPERVTFSLIDVGGPPAAIIRVPWRSGPPITLGKKLLVPHFDRQLNLHRPPITMYEKEMLYLPADYEVEGRQKFLRSALTVVHGKRAGRTPGAEMLDWVVLPSGWLMDGRNGGMGLGREKASERSLDLNDVERLKFIDTLRPLRWWRGQRLGRTEYFVADFDGLVIADAPLRGNALYWLKCSGDDWKGILSQPKPDALHAGAQRIFHYEGWQEAVLVLVGDHRLGA
jgi:hypothetical protein